MEKLIWKLKYRLKQVKGFFKLLECKFRIKYNLMGNETFYYYSQRDLLRELLRTGSEEAYLDYHGLLPEEPEPEPEPEPEKEPGLIRELGFFDLLLFGTEINSDTYRTTVVKEYEDRTVLTMQIMDGVTLDIREEVVETPHGERQRYDPFTLDEESWRWDRADGRVRFCPVVQETVEEQAIAKPVRMLQGFALRVDKALAEEKLSPLCLEYAYHSDEVGYDWCVADYSYCTAVYELELAADTDTFIENLKSLELHCRQYFRQNGLEEKHKTEVSLTKRTFHTSTD